MTGKEGPKQWRSVCISWDNRSEGRCTGLGGLAGKSKQLEKNRRQQNTCFQQYGGMQGREGEQTCAEEDLGTFLLDVHPSF